MGRPGLMQAGGVLNPTSVDPCDLETVLAKNSKLLVAALCAFTTLYDELREILLTNLPTLAHEGNVLG